MIWETLIVVYAVGLAAYGFAVGRYAGLPPATGLRPVVACGLVPGLNLMLAAMICGDGMLGRTRTPPAQEASE